MPFQVYFNSLRTLRTYKSKCPALFIFRSIYPFLHNLGTTKYLPKAGSSLLAFFSQLFVFFVKCFPQRFFPFFKDLALFFDFFTFSLGFTLQPDASFSTALYSPSATLCAFSKRLLDFRTPIEWVLLLNWKPVLHCLFDDCPHILSSTWKLPLKWGKIYTKFYTTRWWL